MASASMSRQTESATSNAQRSLDMRKTLRRPLCRYARCFTLCRRVCLAQTKATAARYLNPIDEVVFAQLVASSAARVAEPVYREADFAHEPSAPRTTVVPLLPLLDPSIVEDEWGLTSSCAHSHRSTPRDDVGWREVSIEAAATSGSSSSLARRPGAAADFVRGSLANNVPFTPGGAGWEDAAAEAAAARQAAARRASVAWLTEYESGVYSGVPPASLRLRGRTRRWTRLGATAKVQ